MRVIAASDTIIRQPPVTALRLGAALLVYWLGAWSPTLAQNDADWAAQRLMEQAEELFAEGEKAVTPDKALALYTRARDTLKKIVESYPSSRLATRLVLGDPLTRRIDKAISETIDAAARRDEACWHDPSQSCVFDLAVHTAESIENLPTRSQKLGEIAAAQAQSGEFDAALAIARSIRFHDNYTLIDIATSLANAGQSDAAAELFAAALSDARQYGIGKIGWASLELVGPPANERSREQAVQFVMSTMALVAKAQANVGQFDAALATARSIENDGYRIVAMGFIVDAQADAGQSNAAAELLIAMVVEARGITFAGQDSWVHSYVAEAQAKLGQFDASLATARSIGDEFWRFPAMTRVAAAQAKAGQFDAALATARSIEEDDYRSQAMSTIAAEQAKSGQFDAALATARSIGDDEQASVLWERPRGQAMSAIAAQQAKSGQFDAALATARSIEEGDFDFRSRAMSTIAAEQAMAGQFDAALATARSIENDGSRIEAMLTIAAEQPKAGQSIVADDRFVVIVEEVLATARGLEPDYDRFRTMVSIAAAEAEAGRTQDALATARSIDDPEYRIDALIAIAIRLD